jgi:hypothetical protein
MAAGSSHMGCGAAQSECASGGSLVVCQFWPVRDSDDDHSADGQRGSWSWARGSGAEVEDGNFGDGNVGDTLEQEVAVAVTEAAIAANAAADTQHDMAQVAASQRRRRLLMEAVAAEEQAGGVPSAMQPKGSGSLPVLISEEADTADGEVAIGGGEEGSEGSEESSMESSDEESSHGG